MRKKHKKFRNKVIHKQKIRERRERKEEGAAKLIKMTFNNYD